MQDEWCAERQPAEQQEDDAEPSGDVTFHNPPSKRAMEKATAGEPGTVALASEGVCAPKAVYAWRLRYQIITAHNTILPTLVSATPTMNEDQCNHHSGD